MNDEMANTNNLNYVFADSNGRQGRDRNLQTKRSLRFEHTPKQQDRKCAWGLMPSGDKE